MTTVLGSCELSLPQKKGFPKWSVRQFQRMEQDFDVFDTYMDVPKIGVPPKIIQDIGFSIINHPFRGTPIFGNTHIMLQLQLTELNI